MDRHGGRADADRRAAERRGRHGRGSRPRPPAKEDKNIAAQIINKFGNQFVFRPNSIQPPFDNPKVRLAAFAALNQDDFLKASIGDAEYYEPCLALFVCGTPLASTVGTKPYFHSDFELSKKLLKEANYDGSPVVLLRATDNQVLVNLAPVAKALLEKGGFKVQMLDMDWQSVVARRAKKDPPSQGGWSAFLTSWVSVDVQNPVGAAYVAADCEKGTFGWPCDADMEKLRDQFAHETDPAKQKELAEKIQQRAIDVGTVIWLGQWNKPIIYRKDRVDGWLNAPVPLFWNVKLKG
jgi:peptide/nickel transport system substrate-binding protein